MRIDGIGVHRLDGIRSLQEQAPAAATNGTRRLATDNVDLSARARELQAAQQAVSGLPDVREALVAELKAKIAAGLYNPSPEAIARKLLGE